VTLRLAPTKGGSRFARLITDEKVDFPSRKQIYAACRASLAEVKEGVVMRVSVNPRPVFPGKITFGNGRFPC